MTFHEDKTSFQWGGGNGHGFIAFLGGSVGIGWTAGNRFEFKPVFHPCIKIKQLLHGVKDGLMLRVMVVYRVPCACGACYIRQMRRTVLDRCKELEISALGRLKNLHLQYTGGMRFIKLFES